MMRSSTSERPNSTPAEAAHEAARRSAPGPRGQLITLIGVAPAAPIVTGRPTSPSIRPSDADAGIPASALTATAAIDAQDAPASRVRPRAEPRSERAPAPTRAKARASQTFDPISLGAAMPAAPSARNPWMFLAAAAVVGLVGLGVVGKRAYGTASAPATPAISMVTPIATAPAPSEPAPATPQATAAPAAADEAPPAPAPEPAKKHGKPAPHKKHPGKTAH